MPSRLNSATGLAAVGSFAYRDPMKWRGTCGRFLKLQTMAGAGLCLLFTVLQPAGSALAGPDEQLRPLFQEAWASARSGSRDRFDALGPQLRDYSLFPYWQYEDLRHRRASAAPEEMAAFLQAYENWAFAPGLRAAWLKTLGRQGRWEPLLQFGAADSNNTELRCYTARARLAGGETESVLAAAKSLWLVGKSQPKACDPLFAWLQSQGAIDRDLAWQRIRLAMEAGNVDLTRYLARFVPAAEQVWLERWQRLATSGYARLDRALSWRVDALTSMIAAVSLQRLARRDGKRALSLYAPLEAHFNWPSPLREDTMREVALMAAVALEPTAPALIQQVPAAYRDDQLHEWWARVALAEQDWAGLEQALAGLSADSADKDRWRYWRARAQAQGGHQAAAQATLTALADKANYYGFLAADALDLPYSICPRSPSVQADEIDALAGSERFARALELERAGLDDWGRSEWFAATRDLPVAQLKVAAGLARREGLHDRVVYALGDSGELQFYDWRFPVVYEAEIMAAASGNDLEPAFLLGLMRSESALNPRARSSANARGLMQVTPATARALAARHGLSYGGPEALYDPATSIRFGARYLRELMDANKNNPVAVAAAYNAGPRVLERWLTTRQQPDAASWAETLSYHETRDYIPRVLAFTTLYDWRLQNPVTRVSSRMPAMDSATMQQIRTTEVVCRTGPSAAPADTP